MPTITIEVQAIVPVLREVVEERGLSQRALGQQLDVSPQTANNWLRGVVEVPATRNTIARLALFLGRSKVEVANLLGLDLTDEAPRLTGHLGPSRSGLSTGTLSVPVTPGPVRAA